MTKTYQQDESIHEYAKQFFTVHFVRGTPRPSSFVKEVFREFGVEAEVFWKRLKEEGAPMKIDI